MVCSNCGLIIEDHMINTSSEWRAYNREEFEKRARTETTSYTMNNNLSTFISFENRDALGGTLSTDKKKQFYRLRGWQTRIRSYDNKDRNLNKANQELERLCSQLDIPRNVKETAGRLYKKAYEANIIRGYSIESMISACVYAAARIRRVPRTLDEISNASHITKKRVAFSYRIIANRMGIKIPLSRAKDFLVRMGTELGISGTCQRFAADIIDSAEAAKLTIGKDPSGLAAASLYLATIIKGEKRTQQAIAKVAHVTEVTIRNRHKDLTLVLGPEISLKMNSSPKMLS